MKRFSTYKFRIYPNKTQEVLINKTFGAVRFMWNQQVASFNSYDKETNPRPIFKNTTVIRAENEWMQEVGYVAIQQRENDFWEFKRQRFSKTRKKSIGNPHFKSKRDKQSFRLMGQRLHIKGDRIQLQKIGKVKMVQSRPIVGKMKSVTVSKNKSGQYFAAIKAERVIQPLPKTGKQVGIDVGLKVFLTTSDSEVVTNPRFFRESQAKLKRAQQHLSRKKKGSSRREKCRLKAARIYQKITNQRDWFLHNESTRLVRDYDVIAVENLNVSGMRKNRKISKSVSDAGFSKFFEMLRYKADWYGKEVVKVGRFEPTSKRCSCCGWIKTDLTLKHRTFECDGCGLTIDRDYNAALNIKALGVDSAQRVQSDHKTSSLASCGEALRATKPTTNHESLLI